MKNSSGGISFVSLLGLAFIVLKLVGVITWSWFWVLSPFWISFAVAIVFLVISVLLYAIARQLEKKSKK